MCTTQVPEYEAWKDSIGSNASKFSVKYYKGLGTSTAAEARDYFSDLATHQLDFDLLREGDGDLVDMAFSKKRVEDRKTWLRSLEPGAFVDYGVDALAYKDFVRSRRPVVWRRLHAIDATRVHQTRPFGPRRATAMLRAGPQRVIFVLGSGQPAIDSLCGGRPETLPAQGPVRVLQT